MRQLSRQLLREEKVAQEKGGPETDEKTSGKSSPKKAEAKSEPVASKAKKVTLPAWAYGNEEKAEEAMEAKIMEEDESLLDFASGLDFEKFMDDMEVKTMMAKVAERIQELEKEMKNDADRSAEADERAVLRQQLGQYGGEGDGDFASEAKEAADMTLAQAKALIAEEEGLAKVHSTQSVAAKIKAAAGAAEAAPEQDPFKHSGTPVIAVHDDSEGARLKEKESVGKLPYMNRNPAV